MKLKAVLYIDDDGLGGTLSIFDEPCSQPICIHADIPLSPGVLACVVEYIAFGAGAIAQPPKYVPMVVSRRLDDDSIILFEPSHMKVYIKGDQVGFIYSNSVATMIVSRKDVLLDMSNEWDGDMSDDDCARPALEDIE